MPQRVGGRKTDAERARVLFQFLQERTRGRSGDVRFTGRRTAKDIEENGAVAHRATDAAFSNGATPHFTF